MINPFYVVRLQLVPGNMISHFSHLFPKWLAGVSS